MLRKKYLLLLLSTLFVANTFIACGSNNVTESNDKKIESSSDETNSEKDNIINADYERDATPGHVIEVPLDEALEKVRNKETFILCFSVSTCSDCKIFDVILDEYLPEHNVKITKVVLDKEGNSDEIVQANRKKINELFPGFNSTPSTYVIENGEIKGEIFEVTSYGEFDEWVIQHKLDELKR